MKVKTYTPACLGGAMIVMALYIAIFLEVTGYASQEEVGKILSLSFIPAFLGLMTSMIIWFHRRTECRQQGPMIL